MAQGARESEMIVRTMMQQTVPLGTWARMLAKAQAEGVEVRQLGSGMWITTSGTNADAAYAVNLHECECPGHAYHGYCKHRAALATKLGHLKVIEESRDHAAPSTPARKRAQRHTSVQMAGSRNRHAERGDDVDDMEDGALAAA